jgi:hypothetical protein
LIDCVPQLVHLLIVTQLWQQHLNDKVETEQAALAGCCHHEVNVHKACSSYTVMV